VAVLDPVNSAFALGYYAARALGVALALFYGGGATSRPASRSLRHGSFAPRFICRYSARNRRTMSACPALREASGACANAPYAQYARTTKRIIPWVY
jgi:hypothetical protein